MRSAISKKFVTHLVQVVLLIAVLFPQVAYSAWYDADWTNRKQITISAGMTPNTDQTNFPVLITLTSDAQLTAGALANGNDILFTQADGTTKLDHEIEKYISATGELVVWVRVPTLSSTVDTTIYLYYGNSGASNQENSANVWNSDYVSVWHMKEDPSLGNCAAGTRQICDSTLNSHHGSSLGAMDAADQIAGKIGGAIDMDSGTSDHISYDCPGCPSYPYTISLWFNARNLSGTLFSYNFGVQASIAFTGGYLHVNRSVNLGALIGLFSTNSWYRLDVVYPDASNSNVKVYVNGIDQTIATNDWWNAFGNSMGRRSGGSALQYDGALDEVRIESIARSADWIQTSYNNQNSPASYLVYGTEESSPAATITISGTAYLNAGPPATVADGTQVRLLVNGLSVGTGVTTAGAYSIPATISAGDAILIYVDDNAAGNDATTVTVSDGNDLTNLDMFIDQVLVQQDNADTVSNLTMRNALGNPVAYLDSEILYTVDTSNNLTVNGATTKLDVPVGYTYAPGGNITTPNLSVNGTVNFGSGSYLLQLTNTGTPLTVTGTFSAGNSTVQYTGSGSPTNIAVTTYNSLQLTPSSPTTYSLTGNLTGGNALSSGSLIIDTNATLDATAASNYNLTAQNITINGAYLARASTISLLENWINNGTFMPATSTVSLDGLNHSLTGSTTFNTLVKVDVTNDATDSIITFDNTAIQTINGTLTLNGLDADDRINLVSDSPGNQWSLVLGASATKAIDFVDVHDSDASVSNASLIPVNPTNSVDSGNNIQWFPGAILGNVYTNDDESVPLASKTINLLINGSSVSTTTSNASGVYSISATPAPGDTVLVFIDDEPEDGVTVTVSDGSAPPNLNIYQNHVVIRHDNGGALTNAHLVTA